MTAAIVLFARHPTPGRVKTRLARDTGAEVAARFYRACAEHVISQALSCPSCTAYLFFSEPEEQQLVEAWLAPLGQGRLVMRPQVQSACLGDRMFAAMAACLQAGHSKVLIIGTDVPDLSSRIIYQAVTALDAHQLVFGAAEDGGYYLMGATAMPAGIFDGIQWSTGSVLEANLANAAALGLRVAPLGTLPRLADIDTVADLGRWLAGRERQQQQQQQPERQPGGVECAGAADGSGGGQEDGRIPAALLEAAAAALAGSAKQT